MYRLVITNRIILYSTIVAPFDKADINRMKTTNDLERCVIRKIFREQIKGAYGITENSVTGELKVIIKSIVIQCRPTMNQF